MGSGFDIQFGIRNGAAAAALLLPMAFSAALSACAAGNVNPVTGKTIFMPVSPVAEANC